MRRGHPGIGGWRNDNQRHFRPRSGGTTHFRGYRNPGLLSTPRFPPPMAMPPRGPRLYGGPQNDIKSGHNVYRHNFIYQRRDRSNQYSERTPYSIQHMRYNVNLEQNNHQKYNEQYHSDTIDRQSSQQEIYSRPPYWESPSVQNRRHTYNERSYKIFKHHEQPTVASTDYTGHRPPASDHYGTNSGPDNSDSFSRSVDDTVNIVRERLLNRNDSQYITEELNEQKSEVCRSIGHKPSNSNEVVHQEQTTRKRILKPRNTKSNCDQIKNKIVHQLFKMDKGKIHKLMDNPSSSSKFEFAISSLISESQNTLNRHLRSVAEKSLCSTTTSELIQNNNDSIYEDTFMKQMQCILDPQDTVLLEDIKPIIMAELQKVLQLNEFDHRFEIIDEQIYQQHETQNYDNYDNFEDNNDLYQDVDLREEKFSGYHDDDTTIEADFEHKPHLDHNDITLFERRANKTDIDVDRRNSIESRRQIRQSVDNIHKDQPQPTVPLFDSTTQQLSEDEDPFAELDRQYHVVVDHNLIEEDICDSQTSSFENTIPLDNQPENQVSFQKNPEDIKQEIDNQLHILAKSPLKLFPPTNFDQNQIKQDYHDSSGHINASPKKYVAHHKDEKTSKEHQGDKSNCKLNTENQDCVNNVIKTTTPYKERKRAIDQRPSHRKEKRKKSDSFLPETNKQILNKNIIINVNDCAKKSSEKCEAPKSVFNLFFSKNESSKQKDAGKIGSVEKEYSDKYVKRKEFPNKILKEKGKKRLNSNSSSHSTELSPSDKIDAKTKLKSIDMFLEQPKKVSPVVKKAAIPSNAPLIKRSTGESKKIINYSRKGVKTLNAAVQVMRKLLSKETQTFESRCIMTSRFCQTEIKKLSKSVQTSPVTLDIPVVEFSDPLERMKQIDMEIQKLLQEKFKLYNSLESKDSCCSSMPTLGMTVLNVKESEPAEDDTFSGDTIADDFTNIPVEELEEIAFESVHEVSKTPKTVKRNRRQKIIEQERITSESPPITKKNKRVNTPNISLIEQIITDDRPLEDIISLDEFEAPAKTRKKSKKTVPKKKLLKKNKKCVSIENLSQYHIKECFVMLNRIELSKYNIQSRYERPNFEQNIKEIEIWKDGNITVDVLESENTVGEETVVSDNTIQFDMLDVSEDIIIGESCEVKLADDKDLSERIEMTVSEEIILDNSQSSCEDVPAPDLVQTDCQCKLYDYSANENLQRDATTVTGHADAVLAIEYIDNNFVAACLDGNVYYFSCEGHLISTLRGSNLAVTCLTIVKEKFGTTLYSGSLDSRIRYYDLETGLEKGPECNVLSPIQTMDRAWDTIFVGTRTGFVLQFECKNNMLIPVSTVKFSDQSILALRALKEGPRKVLLVAARSENVTIKDAQTGLLLRTLDGPKMTVYTLLYEDGKVFCGTSSHQIYVFDYYSGSHVGTHEGGKGAVCLRAAGGLVFAGCYDGCVYVYRDGETAPFAQLRGPSLMLLSLAVHGTKIVAGYKDRSLYIWKIPLNILQEMIL